MAKKCPKMSDESAPLTSDPVTTKGNREIMGSFGKFWEVDQCHFARLLGHRHSR